MQSGPDVDMHRRAPQIGKDHGHRWFGNAPTGVDHIDAIERVDRFIDCSEMELPVARKPQRSLDTFR